jgi:polyisoprenoid-binding protein YceI
MSVTEINNVTTALTPGTYALDLGHTHVGFKVRHLMVSKVRGRFTEFDGTVTIAPEPLDSSVEVTVKLASVDTGDEQRDGHLRSADFFGTDPDAVMRFRSTGVRPVGEGEYEVDGELSLLGVTKPLTLHVEFNGATSDPWGGQRVGFTATAQLDREDFGLTWNATLETGGVVVGKRVDIEIEAEAILQGG